MKLSECNLNTAETPTPAKGFKIAIDGTSASGKSSIAKFIARELNFTHINSGNLYRSIAAFFVIYYEMDFKLFGKSLKVTEEELNSLADYDIKKVSRLKINEQEFIEILEKLIKNRKCNDVVFNLHVTNNTYDLNGHNITQFIRSTLITNITMIIAQVKILRTFCNSLQTKFISNNIKVVCDGRDIGTNIIPDAELKLFIVCEAEIRAKRRLLEMCDEKRDYETVLQEIKTRDKMDIERKEGPLKKTEDAVVFDTGNKTEEQCFTDILKIVMKRMEECGVN